MVNADVVARRLLALNESLTELQRPEAGDARALMASTMLLAAVERWLQVAIESCVDVATHKIATEGWTPPETSGGSFATLAAHGELAPELAKRLRKAAGLRNVLVHDYVAVDVEQLALAVRDGLGDLKSFAAVAATWIA
jgi:uncharacterized protein YutE (UPF0331/DUF86 family)